MNFALDHKTYARSVYMHNDKYVSIIWLRHMLPVVQTCNFDSLYALMIHLYYILYELSVDSKHLKPFIICS